MKKRKERRTWEKRGRERERERKMPKGQRRKD